eukprot:8451440-Pyramimonas_sp.AAC.1
MMIPQALLKQPRMIVSTALIMIYGVLLEVVRPPFLLGGQRARWWREPSSCRQKPRNSLLLLLVSWPYHMVIVARPATLFLRTRPFAVTTLGS